MIFVTVGAQMSFDRMVHAVDDWARARDRGDCFAQIGPSERPPGHIRWERFLKPSRFRETVEECDAIVAHAGMGSIITALQHNKPILVMPRRGSLRETRNDHQVATAERFEKMGRVRVAWSEDELPERLDELSGLGTSEPIREHASVEMIDALRAFLRGEKI
ncbi:MAG: glycosyltransferase [Planctomycetota bacterium]